jgi:flagellar biosynthesis/type III secretory pathway M-ring protein FliF/YscJ
LEKIMDAKIKYSLINTVLILAIVVLFIIGWRRFSKPQTVPAAPPVPAAQVQAEATPLMGVHAEQPSVKATNQTSIVVTGTVAGGFKE